MSSATVQLAGAQGINMRMVAAVAANLEVFCGLVICFASAAVWLLVLSCIAVGHAYPSVGLGFVVTMLLAWLVRGENPSVPQIVRTLSICSGVTLVARA